jgi:glycerophosphoryl diester phosphodiesterase
MTLERGHRASLAPRSTGTGDGGEFNLQAHRVGLGSVVEKHAAGLSQRAPAGDKHARAGRPDLRGRLRSGDARRRHCEMRRHRPRVRRRSRVLLCAGQRFIEDLTLAQVRTIDCGSLRLPRCPAQRLSPGERIPLLSEVFELVHAYRANRVTLNIETKVEAGAPVTARKEGRRSRAVTAPAPRRQGVGLNSTQVREALYEFCPGIEGAVGDAALLTCVTSVTRAC